MSELLFDEVREVLRKAEARYHGMARQQADGVLVVDGNGVVHYANPAAATLLQQPVDELLGETFGSPVTAVEVTELDLVRHGENPLVAEMRVAPIEWDGTPASLILLRDVTQRRQAERELVFQAQLLEAVEQAVIATRLDGEIIYWNRYATRLHGWEREQVQGHNVADVILTETARALMPEIQAQVACGAGWAGELWVRRKDAAPFIEHVTISPLRDDQGEISGMVGVAQEITERKTIEAHLAWESAVNALAADLAETLLVSTSLDEISYKVLQHAQRLTGSTFGFVGYIDPETGYLVSPTMTRDIWEQCQIHEKSFVFQNFSGLWGWVLQNRVPLLTNTPGGDPRSSGVPAGHIPIHNFLAAPALAGEALVGLVALANADREYTPRDLALVERLAALYALAVQQARIHRALRLSEAQHRTLFETMTQGVVYYEPGGRITHANPAAARILGMTVEELTQRNFHSPEWRTVYETDPPLPGERHATTRMMLRGERIQELVVGVYNPQKAAYVWLNVSAVPLFREGEEQPYQVYATFSDITARKQMEAQLRDYAEHLEQRVEEKVRELEDARAKVIHAGRLAALGEMATGVAHELNQPLTSMMFDADYLKTLTEQAQASAAAIELAEVADVAQNLMQDIERCRTIINHLRAFGRVPSGLPDMINLNQPLENTFILTNERLRLHSVHLERDLAADLPPILGNVHKLEQVFLNLISNAEYALNERARCEAASFEKRLRVATRVEGDWVVAEVEDNGSGIPEGDHTRMFNPFFTTKPVGEGTGLGLSISYGIVRECGGEIVFESAPNVGTKFTLRFPAANRELRMGNLE